MSHFVMLQPDYKRMCRATEQTNFRIGECLIFTNQQFIAILMVMMVADSCSIGSTVEPKKGQIVRLHLTGWSTGILVQLGIGQ